MYISWYNLLSHLTFIIFLVLWIKLRAFQLLDKFSTTTLYVSLGKFSSVDLKFTTDYTF